MSNSIEDFAISGSIVICLIAVVLLIVSFWNSPRPQTGAYCMIQPDGKPDYTRCVTLVPTATDAR